MWVSEPGQNPENPAIRKRLLDDHLHDVPPPVFELLALLAQHAPQPLDVIIERDGAYPDIETLLSQLDAARSAMQYGRSLGVSHPMLAAA